MAEVGCMLQLAFIFHLLKTIVRVEYFQDLNAMEKREYLLLRRKIRIKSILGFFIVPFIWCLIFTPLYVVIAFANILFFNEGIESSDLFNFFYSCIVIAGCFSILLLFICTELLFINKKIQKEIKVDLIKSKEIFYSASFSDSNFYSDDNQYILELSNSNIKIIVCKEDYNFIKTGDAITIAYYSIINEPVAAWSKNRLLKYYHFRGRFRLRAK